MPDFNAKMHQNRLRLALRPRPRWGAYNVSQTPQLDLRRPISKDSGVEGRGEEREGSRPVCLLILTIIFWLHSLPFLNRTQSERSHLLKFLTPVMVVINYLTIISVIVVKLTVIFLPLEP